MKNKIDKINNWMLDSIKRVLINYEGILEVYNRGNSTLWIKIKNSPLYAGIKFLNPGENAVVWSVDDFEARAIERIGKNWSLKYDESKFQEALDTMIDKHNADMGINWSTVDHWLDEICKIDE